MTDFSPEVKVVADCRRRCIPLYVSRVEKGSSMNIVLTFTSNPIMDWEVGVIQQLLCPQHHPPTFIQMKLPQQ